MARRRAICDAHGSPRRVMSVSSCRVGRSCPLSCAYSAALTGTHRHSPHTHRILTAYSPRTHRVLTAYSPRTQVTHASRWVPRPGAIRFLPATVAVADSGGHPGYAVQLYGARPRHTVRPARRKTWHPTGAARRDPWICSRVTWGTRAARCNSTAHGHGTPCDPPGARRDIRRGRLGVARLQRMVCRCVHGVQMRGHVAEAWRTWCPIRSTRDR